MAEQQALALVRTVIRSVWALELLLLMRRDPDRRWSEDALVRELRASLPLVRQNLAQLETGGLIACEPEGCRFAPASPLLEKACAVLDRAYRERPVSVVNLIVGMSSENVQGFADAFRFKRGDE